MIVRMVRRRFPFAAALLALLAVGSAPALAADRTRALTPVGPKTSAAATRVAFAPVVPATIVRVVDGDMVSSIVDEAAGGYFRAIWGNSGRDGPEGAPRGRSRGHGTAPASHSGGECVNARRGQFRFEFHGCISSQRTRQLDRYPIRYGIRFDTGVLELPCRPRPRWLDSRVDPKRPGSGRDAYRHLV